MTTAATTATGSTAAVDRFRLPGGVDAAATVQAAATMVRKQTFTDQVELLLTTVGPRITAAGAGLSDARQLPAWRRGEEPREEIRLERVAALAEVATAVMADYPASVAASFLRGSQPALDDHSPVLMIRGASEKDLPKVMSEIRAAVRAFLQG